MKNDLQFIKWYPEWHGFHFIRGNPLKEPAAFHLIYKWSVHFGFWEVRRFLSDTKRHEALNIYKHNKSLT